MDQLTFDQVAEAISGVLAREWPDRLIYRDVCPVGYEQPSFFLQCVKTEIRPESRALWRFQAHYLLTLFDVRDEYYEVSAERLLKEQVRVLALFSAPVLEVAGRFPSVSATVGEGRDPDAAFVSIHVEWLGSVQAYLDEQKREEAETELMEDFSVRTLKSEPSVNRSGFRS